MDDNNIKQPSVDHQQGIVDCAHKEIEAQEPEQKEYALRNKQNNFWMIVFTAVIAFTGVISGIIFYKQLQTMHGQLAVMSSTSKQTDTLINANNVLANAATEANKLNRELFAASERPWVLVDVTMGGPIIFHKGFGMDITLKLTLQNVGHTPAMYVFPALKMDNFEGKKLIKKQSELCQELKHNEYLSTSFMLFPSEKKTVFRKIVWTQAEMKFFKDGSVLPVVTGCVDYKMTSRQEHHQTGFAYVIGLKNTSLGKPTVFGTTTTLGGYEGMPLSNEPIPESSLSLSPWGIDARAFFAN